MSLIPTIYSSDDPGAPQLSGTVGSLISLLRAILVAGYGTAPNDKPGLGWTEEFTAGNVAVFRGSPVSGSGYRVRVDDSNAQYALLRGFSSMSDVDTGQDPTPTVAQYANGTMWAKSSAADASARPWWAIGNERAVYLFLGFFPTEVSQAVPYFIGDVASAIPGDSHAFMLSTGTRTSFSTSVTVMQSQLTFRSASLTSAESAGNICGHLGRARTQMSGAVEAWLLQGLIPQDHTAGSVGLEYPYPSPSGRLFFEPALVLEGVLQLRGQLPGCYVPLHDQPLPDLSESAEAADLPPGASLLAKSFWNSGQSSRRGQLLFVTGVEWD